MRNYVIKDEFDNEIKNSHMKNYARMIVDEFLIYKKHLNINKLNYKHIVNGANDEVNLSEDEVEEVINMSKTILKNEYGIEIVNDNPIKMVVDIK